MNYGLYLSAGGVVANSYRQDVIANNIANVETAGFKRHTATFRERLTEAQANGNPAGTNPLMENIGGGLLVDPTQVDFTQGELEATGNSLDLAVQGDGYFAVSDRGQTRLTRDGRFMLDRDGHLIMATGGQPVLDIEKKPIQLDPALRGTILISDDATISQAGLPVAQIGLFGVKDSNLLTKVGGTMFDCPDLARNTQAANGNVRSGFVERANVDPATELVQLMDAQRQLEANANMIRFQDQALGKLVNEVGKI